MHGRISLYQKMNIILICLLTPIILLSLYSNRISNNVVREEIEKSSETYLALLSHQIDSTADQLSTLALSLNRDPSVRAFASAVYPPEPYDRYFLLSNLSEKLGLTSSSISWQNIITVHAPQIQKNVSSMASVPEFDGAYIDENMSQAWTYHTADFHYGSDNFFMRYFVEPTYNANRRADQYNVITEVSFSQKNLVMLLDMFKANNNVNDPLLYKPGLPPIHNSTSQIEIAYELLSEIGDDAFIHQKSIRVDLAGHEYMATIQPSETLGWYLIDYVPIDDILAPIDQMSAIFYVTVGVLVVIGAFLSFMIYRNVQRPVLLLIGSVRALMRGDYSKRMTYKGHYEFMYLIEQFNLMAQQIQELIEKVYESRIRMQEATLKQLQSQIDPHFLYNCLNFIKNSARMKDEESVVSMSIHLGEYYRYVTRLETSLNSLEQEIELIVNYLEIHKLRHHKLDYQIHIPETMMHLALPRLLLQPVVENAIEHGISSVEEAGLIRISGTIHQGEVTLSVEDNGEGMTAEERTAMQHKLMDSSNQEQLCGLWNVSQRLILQFGKESSVTLTDSELGGLKVVLRWRVASEEPKKND
ncbi:sensor histidine kinase [Paenibacillus harenae]|uniref:sensor histidine kinase n=1 Tax=Paenibacillus harenae TaxID=306543 RepID=UPI0004906CDB|nr:histidine kinase [Paenibacillus harenae]